MIKTTRYKFLIRQHKSMIYGYARNMLRNRMDADDVTQEVFIRIWENLDEFNILAAKAWIMRTTHNLCIDYLRRRSVSDKRELSITEEFAEIYPDNKNAADPYHTTHVSIMAQRVNEAIDRLPESLKSVFTMYEIHELKYKEISQALDMPVNTVKVYLLRARKRLQEDLRQYEPQEFY